MPFQFKIIIVAIVSYFLGNISPAILVGRLHGIDIRKEGSGNAGTTNVLRVLGVKAAVATLAIDVLKGYVAVRIGLSYGDIGAMIAFICVVYGHIFPALYKFKGGKGVATSLGAALALDWPSAFALILIAIAVTALSRKMSLGSITAAVSYPFLIEYYYSSVLPMAIVLAVTVIVMHRSNIQRLIRKEEPSLSFGGKNKKEDAEVSGEKTEAPKAPVTSEKSEEPSQQPVVFENSCEGKLEAVPEENPEEEIPEVSEEIPETNSEEPMDYFSEVTIPKMRESDRKRIAVIGETPSALALANRLLYQAHNVVFYVRNKEEMHHLTDTRHSDLLPDVLLCKRLRFTANAKTAVHNRSCIIMDPADEAAWKKCVKLMAKTEQTIVLVLGDAAEELPEELRAHRIVYLEKPETVNTLTHNEDVTVNARSKDKDALKTVEEMLRDETFRIKTIEEE
mgnify:CR=1 FL=1